MRLSGILVLFFISISWTAQADSEPLQGQALHTKLVETALQYDTFNQRCRGVSAAKNKAAVNRLFIRKYRLTFNNYIKVYLTPDPRETENRVKDATIRKIAEQGGCQQARQKGFEKQLKKTYRRLYEAVEPSPWFPELP